MDVSSLVKKGQPSVEPHELTLITDKKDPLYDHRIELPIADGAILNFAAVGQVQPISIKPRGLDELVVVDGLQRVKRALVINHLCGRQPYTGKLAPVLDAIKRLAGTHMGTRIIEEAGSGVKLQVTLYRGGDKDALRAKPSANIWRVDEVRADRIRKAQQMARHGIGEQQIQDDLGIKSAATLKRMLAADPDKPAKAKARGKATRPSVKRLATIAEALADVHPGISLILGWVAGARTEADVLAQWDDLADAIKASKKGRAAKSAKAA